MKKSVIVVVILLLGIALLPLIGNVFLKKTLDERVLALQSYGLEVKQDSSLSSYLSTSRHFEFLLKDSQAFIDYLSQYSNRQIPPYVNALLEGMRVGADVTYSNLPFAKAVEIEIYPLSLSEKTENSLKMEDVAFCNYLEKTLQSKSILYHINYNFLNADFDGYIKDIDEKYTLKDGTKIALLLHKATFSGNGKLIAPNQLKSRMKTFVLKIEKNGESINFVSHNFSATSNFESQTTYITSADLDDLNLQIVGTEDDANVTLQKLRMNASSNTQGKSAELNSKSSVDFIAFHSRKLHLEMQKFTLDIALSQLDKQIFEQLVRLVAQDKALQTQQSIYAIRKSAMELLSKGFVLDMADFSLRQLDIDDENLQGFDMKAKLTFSADNALVQKVKLSPLLLVPDLEFTSKLAVSKKLLKDVVGDALQYNQIIKYALEKGDEYEFDLRFIDSKATINGKALN